MRVAVDLFSGRPISLPDSLTTVSLADLGTGTLDATTVLHGNGTWSVPYILGLKDGTDLTKQATFDLSGIATATTRTLSIADMFGTLALQGNPGHTFYPESYGGGTGVADNTTAVQACIDAAFSANGGIIKFQPGTYTFTGALQSPSTFNSVLTIPDADYNGLLIQFEGAQAAVNLYNDYAVDGAPVAGTILKCTTTGSGTEPSFLSANAEGSSSFTHTSVVFHNFNLRASQNPTISVLNFRYGGGLRLENVSVDTAWTDFAHMPLPTTASSAGIIFPQSGNSAECVWVNGVVAGFYTGVKSYEHTKLDNVKFYNNIRGLEVGEGVGTTLEKVHFNENIQHIRVDPAASYPKITGKGVELECNVGVGGNQPFNTVSALYDSNKKLEGFLQGVISVNGTADLSDYYPDFSSPFLSVELSNQAGASIIRQRTITPSVDPDAMAALAIGDTAATGGVPFGAHGLILGHTTLNKAVYLADGGGAGYVLVTQSNTSPRRLTLSGLSPGGVLDDYAVLSLNPGGRTMIGNPSDDLSSILQVGGPTTIISPSDGSGYLKLGDAVITKSTGNPVTFNTRVASSGILLGTSQHANFGTVAGDTGYGVRDAGGTVEFKNSGGSWLPLLASSGSGASLSGVIHTADTGTVTTTLLTNSAVTLAKMADITGPVVLGRTTADGTGAPKALALGAGVLTAASNTPDSSGGLLTYGIIGTSGTKLGLLNADKTDSGANIASGSLDMNAASFLKLPQSAGAAPTGSGNLALDTTSGFLKYGLTGATKTVANLTGTQTFTNKDLSSGTNTFPTFNQNTTGSAGSLSLSGGGAVTGSSGAVTIAAGGTNQNITLTPSGTGNTNFTGSMRAASGGSFAVTQNGATLTGNRGILFFDAGTPSLYVAGLIGFGPVGTDAGGGVDVFFRRVAAGVAEVNSGTAGSLGAHLSSRLVAGKTANYTVVTADKSVVFTNTGAAGAINFSLPAAVVGNTYTFSVEAAQTLTCTANGTDTIRMAVTVSAAGGTISSNVIGTNWTIVCTQTGKWVVFQSQGTPTVV